MFGSGGALFEMCYVGNTVEGIYVASIKKEAIGKIYFISDSSKNIVDTIKKIAKLNNLKVRIVYVPYLIAYFMAIISEIFNYIFPFPPFRNPKTGAPLFSRKTVEWTSKSEYFCSTEKAKKELGYIPPFSFEEGVKRTVMWYKKEGFLQ
jgi:nucleoside-diphosphate-sugar epimerase